MSESPLTITVQKMTRVDLMTVNGRIDSATAPELDARLNELMGNGRYQIVMDLAQTSYMSSAGLRAIVAALRECKKYDGDVRLAAPSERVSQVLDLAGLDSLFQTFDDALTAVGSF